MKKEKYVCPICGYDRLEFYPSNSYEICPCCGYEFGSFEYFKEDLCDKFHDENDALFSYIRNIWIKNGSKWWSMSNTKPKNWNWEEQIKNIKSKKRIFEEKVVHFFVSQIPEINDFVKDCFEYYDITESAGMYTVLPNIIRYLTSCVKKADYVKVKDFFKVYNVFYEEFEAEYQNLANNDEYKGLENIVSNGPDESARKNFEFIKDTLKNETMYNLNAVELFEIIEEFEEEEKKRIIPLMSEKLQKEYKDINKIL